VTSNAGCVTGNPATGQFIPTFSTSVLLSVVINPSQDPVCEGNPATYTAVPTNGGTNPAYEWHINGGPTVGTNSS
jgi:hypothetical protein